MRSFLLALGWSSVVGSFGDGAIGLYALWVIGSAGWGELGMPVETLLQQHLQLIYWVKQVASQVLPAGAVAWIFGMPALVYFPARIAMSCVIGWWALEAARKMGNSSRPAAGTPAAA